MKHIFTFKFLIPFLFIGSLFSCQSGGNDEDIPSTSSETEILSYSISGFSEKADIDATNRNIYLQLPESQKNGTNLCPQFSLSEGAKATVNGVEQISGETTINFTSVIKYNITAGNRQDQSTWNVTVTNNEYTNNWKLGLFLSDSRSNEGTRPDGWYLQQQHTGEYENQNCGPTAATLAAMWSDATFSKSVEDARNAILTSSVGGEASWHPEDVYNYLQQNNIPSEIETMDISTSGAQQQFYELIKDKIDNNQIVVICLSLAKITQDNSNDPECRVNLYYNSTNGHFLVIKGYKVVDGKNYFEIHDPWGLDLKYADGTYKGENRYYRSDDLYAASISHNKKLVVVSLK